MKALSFFLCGIHMESEPVLESTPSFNLLKMAMKHDFNRVARRLAFWNHLHTRVERQAPG